MNKRKFKIEIKFVVKLSVYPMILLEEDKVQ